MTDKFVVRFKYTPDVPTTAMIEASGLPRLAAQAVWLAMWEKCIGGEGTPVGGDLGPPPEWPDTTEFGPLTKSLLK